MERFYEFNVEKSLQGDEGVGRPGNAIAIVQKRQRLLALVEEDRARKGGLEK